MEITSKSLFRVYQETETHIWRDEEPHTFIEICKYFGLEWDNYGKNETIYVLDAINKNGALQVDYDYDFYNPESNLECHHIEKGLYFFEYEGEKEGEIGYKITKFFKIPELEHKYYSFINIIEDKDKEEKVNKIADRFIRRARDKK